MTDVRLELLESECCPMSVTDAGISMEVIPVYWNVLFLMYVRLMPAANVTDTRSLAVWNARFSMVVTDAGIAMEVRPEFWNAPSPMVRRPLPAANVTDVRLVA